jgi:predicted exporter
VIALDGATLEDALARAESLQPLLVDVVARGAIASFASPAQLVPSRAQQALRRAALPDETTLRASLNAALQGTALRAAAFEPFIADVQAARSASWIVPDTYRGTGLGERLAGQIHLSTDRATVFITLTGVSDAHVLRSALRDSPAAVLDLKADVETLIAQYRGRAAAAALGGGLLIVMLLLVYVRDLRVTARIALALAVAVMITAAALVAIEGRLTLFHLVALLLVAGIGSNYALFFGLPPARGAEQSVAVPASVLLCMASTLVAFALLATSSTPVLHMIGLTGALGAVISFITAVALAQPK